MIKKEKVYITRDEEDHLVWIWYKPLKGNWTPERFPNPDNMVIWHREDIDKADCYLEKDFKKKFGITLKEKEKRCVHLSLDKLKNEDYKLFSDDKNRKK
jgi:hypothetical protein